jgi:Uma2 family endonuclease
MAAEKYEAKRAYLESGRERPLITLDLEPSAWTVEDIENLPHDGNRYELHEGSLVIMSPAILWHSRTARRLANLFAASGRYAEAEVGIRFGDHSTRVADVGVFVEAPDENVAHYRPDMIAIAVEIVSPESKERDVGSKPAKYASAGIPQYWRVERPDDDPSDALVHAYRLEDSREGPVYVAQRTYRLSVVEKSGLPV